MSENWFWEGNVQSVIAASLATEDWFIEHVSDTQRRERGVDIRASRERTLLLVEVKGYPSVNYQRGPQQGQPKPTNPLLQSKHWFAEALLAAILLQAAEPDARIAIGLPEVPRYLNLLEKTESALKTLGIIVYLVNEQGRVRALTV